ncbi:ADP-ribosylation factor family-domain-containing protein [Aspergillus floccosus]
MGARISQSFRRENEVKALLIGLDMSGKTTLLWKLKIDEVVTTVPTIGFNVETVQYKDREFLMWDYGGTSKFRPQWKTLFGKCEALIIVVDSTDSARFLDAGEELRYLLDQMGPSGAPPHIPLLLFANKQDLPTAKAPVDVLTGMNIDHVLSSRRWQVVGSSCTHGTGLDEGMRWLSRALSHP